MYKKLFRDLKAKFHILIHYVRMLRRNGPAAQYSSMRPESKHRVVKKIALQTSSRRNLLKTIGIRYALSLMHLKYAKYKKLYITHGPEIKSEYIERFGLKDYKTIKNVEINDYTYKAGTIIIVTDDKGLFSFGVIRNVFVVDGEVEFKYSELQLIGFSRHYSAYSVIMRKTEDKFVKYTELAKRTPCILVERKDILYVVTREKM